MSHLFELMISLIQIAFYEQTKQILLGTRYFEDNVITHFSASIIAVSCACTMYVTKEWHRISH